jgi:hypothetical protein
MKLFLSVSSSQDCLKTHSDLDRYAQSPVQFAYSNMAIRLLNELFR